MSRSLRLASHPPMFPCLCWNCRLRLCVSNMVTSPLIHDPTPLLDLLIVLNFQSPPKNRQRSPPLSPPSPFWMSIKPRLTRARRDSSMAPLSLDRRRGTLECPSPSDSAISSRDQGTTRSQLGLLICSLAPHISLIKTVYCALSNQVSR